MEAPSKESLRTFDTGEAARLLGLSGPASVTRYIRLGLLSAYRYGRGYHVSLAAIERFQRAMLVGPDRTSRSARTGTHSQIT